MAKKTGLTAARKKADKLLKSNRLQPAYEIYLQLSQAEPADPDLWLCLGNIQRRCGDLHKAEASYRRALELRPDFLNAYADLGEILVAQGRLFEAESNYRTYASLAPKEVNAQLKLGQILSQQGKSAEAIEAFTIAQELGCNDLELCLQLGQALKSAGRYQEALEKYQQAITLFPKSAKLRYGLGSVHRYLGNTDQARVSYEEALSLEPDSQFDYLINMAHLSEYQEQYEQALEYLNKALESNSNAYGVRVLHAEMLLRLGRFQEGWAEYECRQHYSGWVAAMGQCEFPKPRWAGEPLNGKTILIYAEQGFGDTLQFSRYLNLLREQGARIIFYCDRELVSLFENFAFLHKVETKSYQKALTESFDFHIPLMSLPFYCGTTLENIPAQVPYIQADAEKIEHWRKRLEKNDFKVGLVWAGRETHLKNQRRSCGLDVFAPLADIKGVSFFSLQKGEAAQALSSPPASMRIDDLSAGLNDFSDTAAAIENLDLVITVDTAVAHLTGALAKPVWTLIYSPPEWRWMIDGDDSPWYPSMRLFRQSSSEEWGPVLERVAVSLRELLAESPEHQ